MAQQLANAFVIEVDGNKLPMQPFAVAVDDTVHMPDMFTVSLRDAGRDALEAAKARIGARVKISVRSDGQPAPQLLIDGEITTVELIVDSAGRIAIFRGYDMSHRLHRCRITAGYQNVTYSDVATKIAKRCGLKPGTIDVTTPVHDHVGQVDQSDAELLDSLATEVGFEVVVEGERLHFRKVTNAEGSSAGIDLSVDDALSLVVGSSLLRLHAQVRGAAQVSEIEARSWDVQTKKALSSTAPVEANNAVIDSKPADIAAAFGSAAWTAPALHLRTQTEVDREAKVAAWTIGNSMAELEGTARGNPRLRPGVNVKIAQVGKQFDGSYVITAVRHTFDAVDGYVSHFTVSGTEDRSLLGVVSTAKERPSGGVAPALVDDVDDPERRCRVRLRFPWLHDDYVTDWVRTVQMGAGAKRGSAWLPEPGDEVLVAFEEGDLGRPYVLAGLFNGVDEPRRPPTIDGSTHAVDSRELVTRTGHRISFDDSNAHQSIEIATGGEATKVLLDETNKKIEITSQGDVTITAQGNITVDATGALKLHGSSVEVQADGNLELTAQGTTSVKGTVIQLN